MRVPFATSIPSVHPPFQTIAPFFPGNLSLSAFLTGQSHSVGKMGCETPTGPRSEARLQGDDHVATTGVLEVRSWDIYKKPIQTIQNRLGIGGEAEANCLLLML